MVKSLGLNRESTSPANIRLEALSDKTEFRAKTFRRRVGNQPEHSAICRVASAKSPLPRQQKLTARPSVTVLEAAERSVRILNYYRS
jgi:hypothetical protein